MKKIGKFLFVFLFVFVFTACNTTENGSEPSLSQQWPTDDNGNPIRELAMSFTSESPSYVSTNSTSWASGSRLYMRLDNGATASGYFDGSSWTFELTSGTPTLQGTCTVHYFANVTSQNSTKANLDYQSIDFMAENGKYYYDSESKTVILRCNLTPNCLRLRFKGTSGQSIVVRGINLASNYDNTTGEVNSTVTPITINVGNDGYTPYIYGTLNSDSRLWVISNNVYWTRLFGTNDLSIAQSAVMDIPTASNRKAWRLYEEPYLWPYDVTESQKVAIKEFYNNMVTVEHGIFNMGDNDIDVNSRPVHQVTLTKDFMINKYELRQKDWTSIVGTSLNWKASVGIGDNYPCYEIEKPEDFLDRITYLSGITFRLPTEAEWEYAARGGNKSKGFFYSGSNNAEDVANCGNWTTPYATIVGKFKANELGLYDMSGNMQELVQDLFAGYGSLTTNIDPVNLTNGYYATYRGGYYQCESVACGYRTQGYRSGSLKATIRPVITIADMIKY